MNRNGKSQSSKKSNDKNKETHKQAEAKTKTDNSCAANQDIFNRVNITYNDDDNRRLGWERRTDAAEFYLMLLIRDLHPAFDAFNVLH